MKEANEEFANESSEVGIENWELEFQDGLDCLPSG